MSRSIAALLGVALLLAGQTAAAQSSKPPPVVAAGPAPNVPWCPPGLTKDPAGKCVAPAAKPASAPGETPTVYQTVNGVRTVVAGPGAAPPSIQSPTAAKPIAAGPISAAKPATAYPKPIAAAPVTIAVGEPNGDCTTRGRDLIHDSRSPGGCAPCPRGRIPNSARQACVIPLPSPYRRSSGG
ncbi:hypothetical protein [Phenylobacterium sp.]|uniref:hypothetical protein n=1 Tax=Phenylobacterium sp. TaxID=1871053 RepID=UPI002727F33D|nr:hypothetical protein [Phenylobacterium sp.]MDO8377956.1 hypothetical protein [Phenylobacterium sp.]